MMKKLWKPALLILPAAIICLLVASCGTSGPLNYNVAGAKGEIPTIAEVVGSREDEYSKITRYAKASEGNVSVLCKYKNCEDVAGDIDAYCKKLKTDCGFTVTQPFDGTTAVLTAPSTRYGEIIRMTISAEEKSYTILTEGVKESETASSGSDSSSSSSKDASSESSSKSAASEKSGQSAAVSSGIDQTAA